MDLSDDIAYSTHDIEDGIKAGKIQMTESFFSDKWLIKNLVEGIENERSKDAAIWEGIDIPSTIVELLKHYLGTWQGVLSDCEGDISRARRELKAIWVNRFKASIGIVSKGNWASVTFVDSNQNENLELRRQLAILKKLAWITLISDIRVQRLEKRSEKIITELWSVLENEDEGKKLMPHDWVLRYEQDKEIWPWERVIADYIAGMTDNYAEKVYGEIFGGRSVSIYEME